MAEFIDVIHTIQRICKKNDGQCSVCILSEFACPNSARFDRTEEAAFRELEDAVVKWAAEHPEPIYPTWVEWFRQMKMIPPEQKCFHTWLLEPIPADIAQKLGITPKENN